MREKGRSTLESLEHSGHLVYTNELEEEGGRRAD